MRSPALGSTVRFVIDDRETAPLTRHQQVQVTSTVLVERELMLGECRSYAITHIKDISQRQGVSDVQHNCALSSLRTRWSRRAVFNWIQLVDTFHLD